MQQNNILILRPLRATRQHPPNLRMKYRKQPMQLLFRKQARVEIIRQTQALPLHCLHLMHLPLIPQWIPTPPKPILMYREHRKTHPKI